MSNSEVGCKVWGPRVQSLGQALTVYRCMCLGHFCLSKERLPRFTLFFESVNDWKTVRNFHSFEGVKSFIRGLSPASPVKFLC